MGGCKMKLRLNSAKAEAQALSLSLAELGNNDPTGYSALTLLLTRVGYYNPGWIQEAILPRRRQNLTLTFPKYDKRPLEAYKKYQKYSFQHAFLVAPVTFIMTWVIIPPTLLP